MIENHKGIHRSNGFRSNGFTPIVLNSKVISEHISGKILPALPGLNPWMQGIGS